AAGNLSEQSDLTGRVVRWSYDGANRKTSETVLQDDGQGNLTQLSQQSWEFGDAGRLLKEVDANLNETRYQYDAPGTTVSREECAHNGRAAVLATYSTFDGATRLLTETDLAGDVTSFSYDANDNQTSSSEKDPGGEVDGSESDQYDGNNNLLKDIDADGN